MLWGYALFGFGLGVAVGYGLFYRLYKHRDIVAELRKNLKAANEQVVYLQEEMQELHAQNTLFREKTTELLEKNDELSDVVAELWKYYVHIKKASEKTAELSKFLHEPDEEMANRIGSLKDKENQVKKSFF